MAKTSTARSLTECEKRGWHAYIVERHNTFSHKKHDAFGFGDVLVMDDDMGSMLLQITSTANMSSRRTKILTECKEKARLWLESGNRIQVWGWAQRVHRNKDGSKSKVKRWTLRVVPVTLGDFA